MRKRYGVEHGGSSSKLRKRARETTIARYGSVEAAQKKRVQKAKETSLRRYGVENRMQDRAYFEAHQKRAFKCESVILDGKTFDNLRGYEPQVLRWLVKHKKVSTKHIQTTAAEGLNSYKWVDGKGKSRVYFPDMRVKINGRWYVAEIKSTFTLGVMNTESARKSGKFSLVRRKSQAVIDAGDRFILLLAGSASKKQKLSVVPITNIHKKTRKAVIRELRLLHPGKFRQL